MAKGGRRLGAGRKPSVLTQAKREWAHLAEEEAKKSMMVLIDLRDHSNAESIRMAAAIEIKNTIWGRPKQAMEHGGKDGEPITIQVVKYA